MGNSQDSKNHEIDWYFDFISPFAYFQHQRLRRDYPHLKINYLPILFGAVLQKYNHKGPAEIPSKRTMTYRYCTWFSKKQGISFEFPNTHPFRPVSVLRLCIAAGADTNVVTSIFEFIWSQGQDPSTEENLFRLANSLGVRDHAEAISQPSVKDKLRENTEKASSLGVFGVPTIAINDQIFWGDDLTEMALEYLEDSALFEDVQYQRLDTLENGFEKKS